jgi:hypothetical protein
VALDLGGPAEVVTSFDHGAKREQQLELLDRIWLLDHPRLADVRPMPPHASLGSWVGAPEKSWSGSGSCGSGG